MRDNLTSSRILGLAFGISLLVYGAAIALENMELARIVTPVVLGTLAAWLLAVAISVFSDVRDI